MLDDLDRLTGATGWLLANARNARQACAFGSEANIFTYLPPIQAQTVQHDES